MIGFVAMGLTGLLNEDAGIDGEESGTIWLCQIVVAMGKRAREGPVSQEDRGVQPHKMAVGNEQLPRCTLHVHIP